MTREINETGIEIINTDLRVRAPPRRLLRDEMLFKVEELTTEAQRENIYLFVQIIMITKKSLRYKVILCSIVLRETLCFELIKKIIFLLYKYKLIYRKLKKKLYSCDGSRIEEEINFNLYNYTTHTHSPKNFILQTVLVKTSYPCQPICKEFISTMLRNNRYLYHVQSVPCTEINSWRFQLQEVFL